MEFIGGPQPPYITGVFLTYPELLLPPHPPRCLLRVRLLRLLYLRLERIRLFLVFIKYINIIFIKKL